MHLTIRIPTVEEELRRVETVRSRLMFYREHGYDVSLPSVSVEAEFDPALYQCAVDVIESERSLIEAARQRMEHFAKLWNIAPPESVTVVVTKYGVGGAFDVDSGWIVVMMKPDGSLLKPAAHLVVHEMLHLASHQTLAVPFGLTHGQNERMIDLLCRDAFGDLLIDYRMQPMGDVALDDVLLGLPDVDISRRLTDFSRTT
jgi:hypothetical protein